MKYDNKWFLNFRKDFAECVKPIEDKYNVHILIGSIRYSDVTFIPNIEVLEKEEKELNKEDI